MKTNNELRDIIINISLKYPEMEITDMLKLIYQNEFGGGHLVKDACLSLSRLKEEAESIKETYGGDFIEDIGNNINRIYIAGFIKLLSDTSLALETLNALFVKSSSFRKGDVSSYNKKLDLLLDMCKKGDLPEILSWAKDYEKLKAFIENHKSEGFPMLSHSEKYRNLYKPSYRVLLSEFTRYIKVFTELNKRLSSEKPMILAVDGKCGSGKSTLAVIISDVYKAPVVKMDDFFLPLDLRTEERLSSPGGNVHYERFLEEVLKPYANKETINYRPFDCSVMDFSQNSKKIEYKNLLIVEGSYSMRPELSAFYGLKIFMDISPEKQKERILERNGKEGFINFENRWIPMENKYFEYYNIKQDCDLVLE